MKRDILVTCALPYANGPLHFGHILEHTLADIWVRFHRLQGHNCYFVCADDTHGTPIMVEARKRNITPEKLIEEARIDHMNDFKGFQISHDIYSSTHSKENQQICENFYTKMQSKNRLQIKSIDQLYCEHDKMFLPDRFVKGTCPKCASPDQYGDACEVCSATFNPNDLKNPYCMLCKNPPVVKSSDQIFFKIDELRDELKDWLKDHTAKEVCNKMMEWFDKPLRDWDISRNHPYFGIKIPGYTDKYFYVWVDAPIGYISATKILSEDLYKKFWPLNKNHQTEIYHFIGKDIIYFHTLFWPALLMTADYNTPNKVFVHGYLTLNGEKMSKSKGTGLKVSSYIKHLDSDYLRFYLATKLGPGIDDVDFNLDDFVSRVNAELVGKITNLASRGASMLGKKFASEIVGPDSEGKKLLDKIQSQKDIIASLYAEQSFHKCLNQIREAADDVNKYFDEKAPWKTVDSDPEKTKVVLSNTLNAFRLIAIYLKPVIPAYVGRVEKLFNEKPYTWSDLDKILSHHQINVYEHLIGRIDPEKIKLMIEDSKMNLPTDEKKPPPTAENSTIDIDTFLKTDLRVGLIETAEEIIEADKLLRLTVDLGPLGKRQIIAGIKASYKASDLVGKKVLVVTNLAPRKMKFGLSEGMILAAGNNSGLFLLSPDHGAKPGDKVK